MMKANGVRETSRQVLNRIRDVVLVNEIDEHKKSDARDGYVCVDVFRCSEDKRRCNLSLDEIEDIIEKYPEFSEIYEDVIDVFGKYPHNWVLERGVVFVEIGIFTVNENGERVFYYGPFSRLTDERKSNIYSSIHITGIASVTELEPTPVTVIETALTEGEFYIRPIIEMLDRCKMAIADMGYGCRIVTTPHPKCENVICIKPQISKLMPWELNEYVRKMLDTIVTQILGKTNQTVSLLKCTKHKHTTIESYLSTHICLKETVMQMNKYFGIHFRLVLSDGKLYGKFDVPRDVLFNQRKLTKSVKNKIKNLIHKKGVINTKIMTVRRPYPIKVETLVKGSSQAEEIIKLCKKVFVGRSCNFYLKPTLREETELFLEVV